MKVASPLLPIASTPTINLPGARRLQTKTESKDIHRLHGVPGLPINVHLLSLDRVSIEAPDQAVKEVRQDQVSPRVLLRVAHVFQEAEHPILSNEVHFDLQDALPPGIALHDVLEVPLNGQTTAAPQVLSDTLIGLGPLQIRTFEATLEAD